MIIHGPPDDYTRMREAGFLENLMLIDAQAG